MRAPGSIVRRAAGGSGRRSLPCGRCGTAMHCKEQAQWVGAGQPRAGRGTVAAWSPEEDSAMRRSLPVLVPAFLQSAVLVSALVLAAGCADTRNGEAPAVDDAAATAADAVAVDAVDASTEAEDGAPFQVRQVVQLEQPWAMAFLPDGRLLVTEKAGRLRLVDVDSGAVGTVDGVPEVAFGGQGGLGDVALHPGFADNGIVYISYAEAGDGDTRGGAVARARLLLDDSGGGALAGLEVIYRQVPKTSGRGHYAHRILFGADGMLWISNGDRQHFEPAQDMASNLGKIVRLNDDGSVPADNPFAGEGEVAAQVWSLGHRNPLGIAFDLEGQLWDVEMGPAGGDEMNRIERGGNYGYPVVSNGDHYDGTPIPDHGSAADTGFIAPAVSWTPVISPSSLLFYRAGAFPDWHGDALVGGLSSQALVRVRTTDTEAREVARYPMPHRIRAIAQSPDGTLYLLEDGTDPTASHLLHLHP